MLRPGERDERSSIVRLLRELPDLNSVRERVPAVQVLRGSQLPGAQVCWEGYGRCFLSGSLGLLSYQQPWDLV